MTTALSEHETLLARLRDLASADFVDDYRDAPVPALRRVVASCEEQRAIYAELGLEDASGETPAPQGKAA
jgi:hypothetical protein